MNEFKQEDPITESDQNLTQPKKEVGLDRDLIQPKRGIES
jgi:hypothetical protein